MQIGFIKNTTKKWIHIFHRAIKANGKLPLEELRLESGLDGKDFAEYIMKGLEGLDVFPMVICSPKLVSYEYKLEELDTCFKAQMGVYLYLY